ncbi:MAG: hypothetical protein H6587_11520 [Flavobacteriales bacterium]|nr:hypothetical protein [Flavobacteriales bacterium]MCB9365190.1 hypothetical protein [Flavobacteriales bacterium]
MKTKVYFLTIILLALSSIAAIQIAEECDALALKTELKKELQPNYKYDSAKTTRFSYKTKEQRKEIEIPLFMGEKYRFLFNTSGLTQNIKIEIYNKPFDHKKRELLYKLEPKKGQHIYTFEPEKSRKMYVTYTIPKVDEPTLVKDCLVLIIGYQLKVKL